MRAAQALGAALLGAGLTYLLDPDRGRRRRALVRDQLVRAAHKTGDAIDTTSRDVRNRARGVVAELRTRLANEEVSDHVLHERVRARVGAVVGRAGAIDVGVDNGRVILSGPILADDVDHLLRRVRAVRGVREVDNRLDVHTEPGDVPALQGRPRMRRGGEVFELMQRNWSPTARVAAGFTGAFLAISGLKRGGLIGLALLGGGLALLTRGAANTPLSELFSLDDWRVGEGMGAGWAEPTGR